MRYLGNSIYDIKYIKYPVTDTIDSGSVKAYYFWPIKKMRKIFCKLLK